MKRYLQLLACALALFAQIVAAFPAAAEEIAQAPQASGEIVTITLNPEKPLLTIPPRFYGINVHPGSVRYEFEKLGLIRALKPDTVRVMTRMRVDWLPIVGKQTHHLSSKPGVYDWSRLDALLKQISAIGAEPYLALGFGPPHWLTNSSDLNALQPPRPDAIEDYADFMAEIVHRYASGATPLVRAVSVENEPENVHYAIRDYIQLFRSAKTRIKARVPDVRVGGPTIGYSQWQQPDGSALHFSNTLARMKAVHVPFDFIDWHIYTTDAETVLNTVKAAKKYYGAGKPLIISELNRDWRYSGADFEESKRNNTGWESVAWLAYLYDKLQLAGVERVYYFGWRENALGLTDGTLGTLRPNYYLLWALTNHIGRQRIAANSSETGVGCIATLDNGKLAMLVYNRTQNDVYIKVGGITGRPLSVAEFNQGWFELNKNINLVGKMLNFKLVTDVIGASTKLPAGGFLILKES